MEDKKAGVKLLLQSIAPQQQVLLMACQASRYDWLRDELGDPPALVHLPVPVPTTDQHHAHG